MFAKPRISRKDRPDGAIELRSQTPLPSLVPHVGHWLAHWARQRGSRTFLAERGDRGQWHAVSYAEAERRSAAISAWLLARGGAGGRPIAIIAENGIDHALLMLGAMQVGVAIAPISTAYARVSRDFARLRDILALLRPALVFVDDPRHYEQAFSVIRESGASVIAGRGADAFSGAMDFEELSAAPADARVADAFARTGLDDTAKILFTSGSTGRPKGVINTQRMLVSNQESIASIWPFVAERDLVIVDWLPWNHTFGGNHNFNLVLRNGGTLYIDAGKPVPSLMDATIANLKDIPPTLYFNVPRGYGLLLDAMERDEALRRSFFTRIDLAFYAGAALPRSLWDRLEAVARGTTGKPLRLSSAWGTTETAPMATAIHYEISRPGNIGVPGPGSEIKLVPVDGKLEIRARGPNITPGYFENVEATRTAFDDEGYFIAGDAVVFANFADPAQGLVFDGRMAENFKLSSGTWVNVGQLRTTVIAACAPAVEDVVIAGHDSDEVGILVFPSLAGMRSIAGDQTKGVAELIGHHAVVATVRDGLAHHNRQVTGSSQRVMRVLLLAEPPSIDAGEITDKGYLNQRAVLANRHHDVARLLAAPRAADDVVVV